MAFYIDECLWAFGFRTSSFGLEFRWPVQKISRSSISPSGDAQALVPAVRKEIRELDPDVPVARVSTMAGALSDSVSLPRFRALLMAIFAATALMLAAIGI